MKVLGVLSAAVGLLTGIGTVVAWFQSDSLWEPLLGAIRIAGLAYMTAGTAGCIVALVAARNVSWGLRVIGVAVSAFGLFSVSYWGVWKGEDFWFFFGWGCAGLAFALVATVLWVRSTARLYRASRMTCPDCAENVKSQARVCRCCGYRFKPALVADGQRSDAQPSIAGDIGSGEPTRHEEALTGD